MTTSERDLIREPSAWMRGSAATRARQINALHLDSTYALVIAPLGKTGEPGTREDRSCDRCGIYVPQGRPLMLLTYQPRPRILLCTGLCGRCAAKEGIR